jgi:uncharacterized protein YukE
MTGADAPALRALAGQMSQSAVQLDRMRQTVRARVYSINWQGLDGANFRRAWDTQHGPMLTRVAEGLRATAQNLLREADQQEAASRAGAGASGQALGGGAAADEGRPVAGVFNEGYDKFLGVAGAFMGLMETLYAKKVSPHWREGRWIQEYNRWARGMADHLNRTLGSADKVVKFGKFVPLLGGVSAGVGQWLEDDRARARGDATFRPGEQQARAVASGVVMSAVDAAADVALPLLGGLGGPVGVVAGYGLSMFITDRLEDPVTDAVSWGVSSGYDVVEILLAPEQAVVDFGGEVLERGRDLLEAGGELAEDAAEVVGDVFTGVRSWMRG